MKGGKARERNGKKGGAGVDRESGKKSAIPMDSRQPGQLSLGDFEGSKKDISIVADTREFNSEVVKHLSRMDVIVASRQLEIGDYILSDRVAVERKTVPDFLSSVLDSHIFSQLRSLKAYQCPLLILEGEGLLTTRNISEEAIFGALSAINVGMGISIFNARDPKETARFLLAAAKRENKRGRTIRLRGDKTTMSLREQQQYILEGLPNISAKLALRLLSHFKSVGAVFGASREELMEVKGVGEKVAEGIREAVGSEYKL